MPSSLTVLLVEDDPVISGNTAEQLAGEGFEVARASNARQAEGALAARGGAFDAVVLDVNLGAGASGYDVARALRANWADLPVVFTTADGAAPFMALHLGRAAHVSKPYNIGDLLGALALARG
ncbi:MAG: response regulator [Proteobacteria bacterium]|nr:response regulator [Pseudomonadota bacterium]